MEYVISCPTCGDVKPTPQQLRFIEESAAKGMDFMVLSCSRCAATIFYNPQDPRGRREAFLEDAKPLLACPTLTCDAFVVQLNEPGEPQEWGCGECGTLWSSQDALDADIATAVESHPYRARC